MEPIVANVDSRWLRLIRLPIYPVLEPLCGAAAIFAPMFLFQLGRNGADYSDWRVGACLGITWVVGYVYSRLVAPVVRAARAQHKPDAN